MTGASLGSYQILDAIGAGGMAQVYLAEQPSMGRRVAIKVLPAALMQDPAFLARFQREIQIVAQLQHAAILPVYDAGESQGQPYLVMAYMPGGTLADLIRQDRGGMPLDRVNWLVTRIASGLDYAHRRGIIHRDFKPSNVLLDEDGNPYIADFGIAKAAAETAVLTGSGIVGTPGFMAPELAQPDGLSPRVDVYALGVTLYQMLTGMAPYSAPTPMGVLMAHATLPVPDPRVQRPELPEGVVDVIYRALAKRPAERYDSPGALAADLQAALNGSTSPRPARPVVAVAAPEEGAATRLFPATVEVDARPGARPASPRRGRAGCIALLLGAIGLGAAGYFLGWFEALPQLAASFALQPTLAAATATTQTSATATLSPSVTPDADEMIIAQALAGVTRKAEWEPYYRGINDLYMALVPAGCFEMGSEDGDDNEGPVHEVCFEQPFWIAWSETTNHEYGVNSPCNTTHLTVGPRNCVSWDLAQSMCEQHGMRLPTEAEWEYAARGPSDLIYPWGNEFVKDFAWYFQNNSGMLNPVMQTRYGVSWVGAYDMSGNVWEWTDDWYGPYSAGAQINPQGPQDGTVRSIRGGVWGYTSETAAAYELRASMRNGFDPDSEHDYIGFRCAMDWGALP